ncbi:VOC family protein [Pullulanibacillus sp. KACC 23026]|uniref:SMU1112c/YaeR family gloxylase I-like metalloprotein n=1 Tax=Pullulanibacillus sp. KACC 23026 TaxID=3028315 RepID=UPI0023B08F7C|nr:VOC family protein [Pullulanibacillus sp. KACC 23026]WEG14891.1 VOC family protein [Pullulanibacillus sp. KACC 23026]
MKRVKLNKIHHIAIICSDYEVSKSFYVNVLGLEILKETYRSERESYKLDLMVNGHYQIELFSFPNSPERASYPEARGLRHLAFEVEDVEEAAAELREKAVEVEEVRLDPITGKKFTFFEDPDHQPIELYES